MSKLPEIAKILRSTEKMAASFVSSVQERVGPAATEDVILAAMRRLNPRSIGISKVVTAVNKELVKSSRRTRTKRATVRVPRENASRERSEASRETREIPTKRQSRPGTLLGQLEEVLTANWNRAEQEGLSPERFTAPDFVRAVHRHCDPRDATRSRVLRACKLVDRQDILISPPTVADLIRKET